VKVLIDTNVLVSAAIKDGQPELVILWVISQPDWTWVVSPEIVVEYQEVLMREKFNLPQEILNRWIELIDKATVSVEVNEKLEFPVDQGDAKFLTCALATQADYLITGDSDFIEARKMITTTILSVSLFHKLVCS